MTDEELKSKAVDIKGKKYVLVSDRIQYFNANYPNGSIETELVSLPDAEMVIVRATVTPDCKDFERKFSDYSQATWGEGYINKSSALENCSTSAVGRALAYMGIGIIDSVASLDEIRKSEMNKGLKPTPIKSLVASIAKIDTAEELADRQERFKKNMELFTDSQQQEIKEAFLKKSVELDKTE